ncbi:MULTISPECIES: substrate-binding domain-containing protein [unclassified Paludibacterium]|uniref:substrate-binding domain-containing protein n=1 Tax=unclassified Paludibacterium TaxID=2618429 RepID=UPI001C03D559|nr:substrate-binding domain-containing protein [Paludibacterium sp. B53371]BEV71432.1 ribose ABC transporter substrate-binding protein RbsB [Paludibacterium sp. THUN1379]
MRFCAGWLRFGVVLTLIGLTSCSGGGSGQEASAPAHSSTDMPVIGLAISNVSNPFFKALKQGAEQAARESGFRLIVLDAHDDTARQQADIQSLIARKVRVLLLNPTDSQQVAASVAAANRAGIPVVTLDRSVSAGNVVAHISSDNMAGGRMAGEYIKDRLRGKGRVVELLGLAGASASIERDQGFNLVLHEAKGLHLLARVSADFDRQKAEQQMKAIIEQYGKIDAVFALNDEMALGALKALQAAGQDRVLVVGFDATSDALAAIRAGKMAATIAQRPDMIGRQGVLTARQLLEKAPIESYIPIPLELVKI